MRYELKYVCDDLDPAYCHQIIRNHPSSFSTSFPDRRINNIYLDSPLRQSFLQNVNGVANRIKYRIRWYGNSWDLIQGAQLEFKIKQNHLGDKRRVELPDFKLGDLPALIAENRTSWGLEDGVYPVSKNSYHRSYYEDFTNQFRITIDSEIHFGLFMEVFNEPATPFSSTIIELKYSQGLKQQADFVQQYLPWRRTKFSKYVEGLIVAQG